MDLRLPRITIPLRQQQQHQSPPEPHVLQRNALPAHGATGVQPHTIPADDPAKTTHTGLLLAKQQPVGFAGKLLQNDTQHKGAERVQQ